MARNVVTILTGTTHDRSAFYAGIVERAMGSNDTIAFLYTSRNGADTVEREVTEIIEIVGECEMSNYGFKGMTDNGPRTFNFHLMG